MKYVYTFKGELLQAAVYNNIISRLGLLQKQQD